MGMCAACHRRQERNIPYTFTNGRAKSTVKNRRMRAGEAKLTLRMQAQLHLIGGFCLAISNLMTSLLAPARPIPPAMAAEVENGVQSPPGTNRDRARPQRLPGLPGTSGRYPLAATSLVDQKGRDPRRACGSAPRRLTQNRTLDRRTRGHPTCGLKRGRSGYAESPFPFQSRSCPVPRGD